MTMSGRSKGSHWWVAPCAGINRPLGNRATKARMRGIDLCKLRRPSWPGLGTDYPHRHVGQCCGRQCRFRLANVGDQETKHLRCLQDGPRMVVGIPIDPFELVATEISLRRYVARSHGQNRCAAASTA